MKEGTGVYTFKNGNVFEGEYKNDKRDGFGIMKFSNGKIEGRDYSEGKLL